MIRLRVFMKRALFALVLSILFLGGLQVVAPQKMLEKTYAATKFSITEDKVKSVVSGYSCGVIIDEQEQRFIIDEEEISLCEIKSKAYSKDKKTVTVKVAMKVDRDVAVIKVPVTIKYKLSNNKWKLVSVKMGKTAISTVRLKGKWKGTYVAGQGETACEFNIDKVSKDGYATGVFDFYATPTNPKVPSGSYEVSGGYDKKTGKVTFAGTEWIDSSSGYSMIDFYAHLDVINKKIAGGQYSLDIKRKK